MRRRGTRIVYWWNNHRERDQYEDQYVGGWILLGRILKRYDGVIWIGLAWLRVGTLRALVNAGMNLRVP
jgi:hypothetical protein